MFSRDIEVELWLKIGQSIVLYIAECSLAASLNWNEIINEISI